MPHQPLARKYRPRNFSEMVGQESILRMLINALTHQRLHHAYLFTGTRGVGKTTLARILAKCLNCEVGISATPCEKCSICQAIDAGKFLDLIEVDAASRTKVEDTREILDNVQYAPTQGRFKIYLIDEVHMLSGHSFNALLKTLEEPPAHVKFLLATTDPKKLPITVLSRCLQFNLKRVPIVQIAAQLKHLCDAENIAHETAALDLIAKAADGSLRDALSLLDQAIAFSNEKLIATDVQQLLGYSSQEHVMQLLHALAENNSQQILKIRANLNEEVPDYDQVLATLLTALHQISIAQLVPDIATDPNIKNLAQLITPEIVQLYYQIALMGRKDLPYTANPEEGFEMVLLRMLAFRPDNGECVTPKQTTTSTTPPVIVPPPVSPAIPPIMPTVLPTSTASWPDLLTQLNLTGMAYALASNCTLLQITEEKIELGLAPQHEPMLNKKLTDRIEQALIKHYKKTLQLQIRITTDELKTPAQQLQQEKKKKQQMAMETIHNDAHVKSLLEMFDASIDVNSIKAVDT